MRLHITLNYVRTHVIPSTVGDMSSPRHRDTPPDDEGVGVEAWAALLRAHAAVVRIMEREVEEATGLPLSWYDVLLELNSADGRQLRMQALSSRVVLSRTRVSRLVDEMERAGLVQRVPDPADGRATLTAITDRGRRHLRKAAPVYLGAISEHFTRHLTRGQLRAIRSGLDQLLAAHSPGSDIGDA